MKTLSKLSLFLLAILLLSNCGTNKNSKKELQGTINIVADEAYMRLLNRWKTDFISMHNKVNIQITFIDAEKIQEKVEQDGNVIGIAPFLKDSSNANIKNIWNFKIASDALIPIFNNDNTYIQQLVMYGTTKKKLTKIFTDTKGLSWGFLLDKTNIKEPIRLYTYQSGTNMNLFWNSYLNMNDKQGSAVQVPKKNIIDKIKEDKLSLGYAIASEAFNYQTRRKQAGIYVLPIDFNESELIDDEEHIYDSIDALINAINGNYKIDLPVLNVNVLMKSKPGDELIVEFLKYIVSEGQQVVDDLGFVPLRNEEMQTALKQLN